MTPMNPPPGAYNELPPGWRSRLHDEAGTAIVWMLGLLILVLGLGGLSIDLWRVFSERRALAGLVDAAAVAGASGINEQAFRQLDELVLDPVTAEELAWRNLHSQTDLGPLTAVDVAATPTEIVVAADGEVHLTLLRILAPAHSPVPIHVTSTSVATVHE